jgi:hypothetical protein
MMSVGGERSTGAEIDQGYIGKVTVARVGGGLGSQPAREGQAWRGQRATYEVNRNQMACRRLSGR